MKFEYIRLKNYIGIYNGMGLNEICIDLNKCKYKKIVIKGLNGSGKSTLMSAIHVLPDNNSSFIPRLEAEKELTISDNTTKYIILIKHGIKNNGERDTTKAYIKKINNMGEAEELNPNGNVSSYKDIIYSELMLDFNFVSLSQLGGEDRGLVDKTPSERKKFVNSILNNLEVYNCIHKNLSKKYSIFKSMINSLNSKINNIGEEQKLISSLNNIKDALNRLNSNKEYKIGELADNRSKIQLLDPEGIIQDKYNSIYNDIISTNSEYDDLINKINIKLNKLSIESDDEKFILNEYKNLQNIYYETQSNIKILESKINSLLQDKENEANNLQSKTAKLMSLKISKDYSELERLINESSEKINNYKSILQKIGLENIHNITKEEFILGLDTLKEIKEIIDIFKADRELAIMKESINIIKENKQYPSIEEIDKEINKLNIELKKYEIEYQKYSTLLSVSEKLNLRPKSCKIDTCEFIKDAVIAENEKPKQKLIELNKIIKNINSDLILLQNNKIRFYKINICVNNMKTMIRAINKNLSIIKKLPINSDLFETNNLLDSIINGYEFNEIDQIYQYITYSNVIDMYKTEILNMNNLSKEYDIYKNKISLMNEINEEIEILNSKLNNIVKDINIYNETIIELKNKLSNTNSNILEMEILLNLFSEQKKLKDKKSELLSSFNNIKNSITEIKKCLNNCNSIENELNSINLQIKPLIQDRDTINHGLKLLDEYKKELSIYRSKFEKVDTIKKYSSPTTGIQTLFMGVYMNKTIELSNQLLSLLFDNKFKIGQFEINENEFRIPCMGSGITNDDISSMSTSEKCMISMILSFVLLYQSSTRYNILKLDEIDGGLDTDNRLIFLLVLDKLLEILNVEQVFIISHNNELDLENCDIIQLKSNNFEDFNGNIIFNLNNI